MATITITVTDVPDPLPENGGEAIRLLASMGEKLALEANGPGPDHPSPKAWRRAAISAHQLMRVGPRSEPEPFLSLALLVALIAGNSDPALDNTTPQRTSLISEGATPDVVSEAIQPGDWQVGPAPTREMNVYEQAASQAIAKKNEAGQDLAGWATILLADAWRRSDEHANAAARLEAELHLARNQLADLTQVAARHDEMMIVLGASGVHENTAKSGSEIERTIDSIDDLAQAMRARIDSDAWSTDAAELVELLVELERFRWTLVKLKRSTT